MYSLKLKLMIEITSKGGRGDKQGRETKKKKKIKTDK